MITVTDDPVLASHCDRVVIMEKGNIIEQGSFEEIQSSPHFCNVFNLNGAYTPSLDNGKVTVNS
jgi:ABC-type dipeptide/oligopeptide/nickel transport system ATPase component